MIDLRSDTITKPSAKMLDAMLKAKVGDDVYGEDPTVKRLENLVADYFGMDRAMFFPSGTMANQVAIKLHTNPGDQVIAHKYSHVYNYEGGGASFNSGVSFKLLDGEKGIFSTDELSSAINPKDFYHAPLSKLVSLENTTNKGGGHCWDFNDFESIKKICSDNNLGLHMDGARIWNSIIAKNDNPKLYGNIFDTVSVCLSKGLGCPIGSILVGKKNFIDKAIRIRKILGGGMRQVGYLAAAGLYAIQNNISRLLIDHERAKEISLKFLSKDFIKTINDVETNIIILELNESVQKKTIIDYFSKNEIVFDWFSMGPEKIRIVTHLDYSKDNHNYLMEIVDKL
ncbi:MAG: threonine aldolase family protein [Flavobacteriaceae bacterium]|nr:MAG: threonine aldolase [Bacteroidota bacterium]|tara:strand:- start:436 stop:1458 length:1023 start_codon:yes stop_codon:yes gene_type:complete